MNFFFIKLRLHVFSSSRMQCAWNIFIKFKKSMRLFLQSNNAKGNKIHFIILNNENNDKLRFRGRMLSAEISQSFSLHNGSHRSLCRLFVIHTVSQVIFTFIWQVFTLYRYCRAEVNQCRTWPHGLWRELGACRNVAHASRSDKNPGVDSLGRKNHR